jgi:indolepyruvate ferredoxin oxidoreductase
MNIATKFTPNKIPTKDVSLEDKYLSDDGTAYDRYSGHGAFTTRANTAGYFKRLSYCWFYFRLSWFPVGNYDNFLWQVEGILKDHHVVFQPGVNEDLAATAIWGTNKPISQGKVNMMV